MTQTLFKEILEASENVKRDYLAPEKVIVPVDYSSVFLAGSIEMGKAKDWQTELTNKILKNKKLDKFIITNPRRKDWNSEWLQVIDNPQFFEQVTWELKNIEQADFVVVYFDEDTQSPITLMELGIVSQSKPERVIVLCPEKFFRKGNVDIVCQRYGIKQAETLEDIIKFLENYNA